MSPKKKFRGRKKDSKKDVVKLSELDKEVYTIKIRDLEDKLEVCRKKNVELETSCQRCQSELGGLELDKQDIVAYLRLVVDQQADELHELHERLDGLSLTRDSDNQNHELQLAQLKLEYQETKDQLTSENIVLSGKLASLEEFRTRKDEMTNKMEQLQAQLKEQESEHREQVRIIERNGILEQERLRQEMQKNLEEMRAEFQRSAEQQMAETTRRAIDENVMLRKQNESMARRLGTIVVENQDLLECKRKQELRINNFRGLETEYLQRNVRLLKVLEDTKLELKEKVDEICQMKPFVDRSAELDLECARLESKLQSLEVQLQEKHDECCQVQAKVSEVQKELLEAGEQKHLLTNVLCNAADLIQSSLSTNSELENDNRDGTLSGLLSILKTAEMQNKVLPAIAAAPSKEAENGTLKIRYLLGDVGITPSTVKSRHGGRRQFRTQATQTEDRRRMLSVDGRRRNTTSAAAAFKILHEVSCPTSYFVGTRFKSNF